MLFTKPINLPGFLNNFLKTPLRSVISSASSPKLKSLAVSSANSLAKLPIFPLIKLFICEKIVSVSGIFVEPEPSTFSEPLFLFAPAFNDSNKFLICDESIFGIFKLLISKLFMSKLSISKFLNTSPKFSNILFSPFVASFPSSSFSPSSFSPSSFFPSSFSLSSFSSFSPSSFSSFSPSPFSFDGLFEKKSPKLLTALSR